MEPINKFLCIETIDALKKCLKPMVNGDMTKDDIIEFYEAYELDCIGLVKARIAKVEKILMEIENDERT